MAGRRTNDNNKPVHHFMAGLGSGVTSATLLQPLDLLKTRTQQQGRIPVRAWIRDITGTGHAARTLWRGTLPSVLRTGFGSAVYFTSLDLLRQRVRRVSGTSGPNAVNLVSGAVARTFAGFLTMPLTIIKVRFESSLYSYSSLAAAVRSVHATSGLRGFFAGFGATAARDGPYAGIYVLVYEMSKRNLGSAAGWMVDSLPGSYRNPASKMPTAMIPTAAPANLSSQPLIESAGVNFASGILAGATCATVSNPFDAVKTRIQLQPHRYSNMMHAFRLMVRQEGPGTLFDGLWLRMARKALSSALAWTIYEELVRRAKFTANPTT